MQRSKATTAFSSPSKEMAPKGQAETHLPHPAQRERSTRAR